MMAQRCPLFKPQVVRARAWLESAHTREFFIYPSCVNLWCRLFSNIHIPTPGMLSFPPRSPSCCPAFVVCSLSCVLTCSVFFSVLDFGWFYVDFHGVLSMFAFFVSFLILNFPRPRGCTWFSGGRWLSVLFFKMHETLLLCMFIFYFGCFFCAGIMWVNFPRFFSFPACYVHAPFISKQLVGMSSVLFPFTWAFCSHPEMSSS